MPRRLVLRKYHKYIYTYIFPLRLYKYGTWVSAISIFIAL